MLVEPVPIPLKSIAEFEMGQSPSSAHVNDTGIGMPFLQGNAEFGPIHPNFTTFCTQPRKICQPGDILISVRAPVVAMNKADRAFCIGRGLAAIRFHVLYPEFGWHALNFWAGNLQKVAQGSTFEAIGKSELQNLQVITFPLAEQRRIAEVLDTVDAAIQATEALIAKLKQMKAGLLHDLLTRGLDAEGNLRDPITHPEQFKETALGRVPREWEVKTLASLSHHITYGFTNPMPTTSAGPWMITAADIGGGQIRYDTARHTSEKAFRDELTSKSRPHIGDVLVTKDGTLGRVAMVDREGVCINQSVACIRPLPDTDRRYLLHYLQSTSCQERMLAGAGGSTIKHLYISRLAELEIPLPPLYERTKLSNTIDSHNSRIRSEETYLTKLLDLKKGLMADLLTGRVRV